MHPLLTDPEFYEKGDFWIFLIIGAFGLLFSILSFIQAKKAKEAAQDAGKIVKIQDVLLDISEIINICQLNFTDDYTKSSSRLTEISGRINYIIGVLNNEIGIINNELNERGDTILAEISKTLDLIREALNKLNPSLSTLNTETDKSGMFYYAIEPYLGLLIAQMNRLSGLLHGHIINSKK